MARVFSEETLKALYDAKFSDGGFYEWLEHMEILELIEKAEFNNYVVDVNEVDIIDRPECKLIGENGNIFNLMAIASRTLRQNDMQEQAEEMYDRIGQSGSYGEALNIIGEYVNITSVDDEIEEEEEGVMMQQ